MTTFSMVLLSDLCEINIGRTPSRNVREFWGPGAPWLSIADMNQGRNISTTKEQITESGIQDANMRLVPKGSLLLSFKLSIGKVSMAQVPLYTNEAIAALPIKNPERLLPEYLYWCLKAIDLTAGQDRAAMGLTLNKAKLAQVSIPLPSMAHQRRIAAVLDQADVLKAKRREALAHLDSLTQSIFVELFGDPVENPNSWPSVQLCEVSDIVTGFAFKSEEYVDGNDSSIKLCRGANVLPGRLDWSDLASWPASKIEQVSAFKLEAGDIVMAMDRPWISEGFKVAQISKNDCPSLLVQRVARLRGTREVSNNYIYHLLNHPSFTAHCRPTETTIPHISPREIRSFRFHLPPVPLQRDFVKRVSGLNHLKSSQDESLKKLDSLFTSLQHRAFRGEL